MELEDYRIRAVIAAKAATTALTNVGVHTVVTGSLARGSFDRYSDIDLLVTYCPRHLKYAIEGLVEDAMEGFSFDVVYLDEVPDWKLLHFTEGSIDASELR